MCFQLSVVLCWILSVLVYTCNVLVLGCKHFLSKMPKFFLELIQQVAGNISQRIRSMLT